MATLDTRSTAVAVGVVLMLWVVAGCSSTPQEPDAAAPTSAAEPSASPSESAPAEVETEPLFVVSARVRAIDGTSIDISLTAHAPVASTSREGADLAEEFVDACSQLDGMSVSNVDTPVSLDSLEQYGSSLVRFDIVSTPEGKTFYAPVDLGLGSVYFPEVASGDAIVEIDQNSTCTGRYQVTGSGTATAIANYESGAAAPDLEQWRYGHYGFSVPFESGATIEACRVEISDDALPSLTDVPGWEPGSDATGISCGTGYRGE